MRNFVVEEKMGISVKYASSNFWMEKAWSVIWKFIECFANVRNATDFVKIVQEFQSIGETFVRLSRNLPVRPMQNGILRKG